MTTTPRGATYLVSAQAIPEATVNENTRRTEAGACFFPVTDRLTTPPGTCDDGANYLITATATDAWTGKENQIATAVGTNAANGWLYHTPVEGFLAYVQDEDLLYLYGTSSWGAYTAGGLAAAVDTDIWTGTSTTKGITPDALFDAAAPQTLTSSSNATAVNMASGINFNLTLDEDSEISNPTNAKPGQSGRIRVTDDGTGGWDLTFAANWTFIGSDPAITTAADEVHFFAYYVNATDDIEIAYLGTKA